MSESKRTKINFESVNEGNYKIIPQKDIAESKDRINEAMKLLRSRVVKSKEIILCSAIWYKDLPLVREFKQNVLPINCDKGVVFCGYRHPHCMYSMISVTGKRSVETEVGEYEQGFLTSKNRFVDRKEGALIHIANGGKLHYSQKELYSEDLY